MWTVIVMILCALAVLACDAPTPSTARPATQAAAEPHAVEVEPIGLLPTSRPTHLARADDGTIWWVQEPEDGRAAAFTLGSDGVPRVTSLTAGAVLAAMGLSDARKPAEPSRARGQFHTLAIGPDEQVWFYFAGGSGLRGGSAVGRFDPQTGSVDLVLDDTALRKLTGMGATLALARGTLVATGGDALWLWVRHFDAGSLFQVNARTGEPSRPFDAIKTAAGETLTLHRPGLALGAGAGELLLLDLDQVTLWRIDPTGRATSAGSLVGLPTGLSAPTGDAEGRSFILAADTPLIPARTDEEAHQVVAARYPAMVMYGPAGLRALGRERMNAPEPFPLPAMRVQQLLHEPQSTSMIGYDEESGALLRFRLVFKLVE